MFYRLGWTIEKTTFNHIIYATLLFDLRLVFFLQKGNISLRLNA